MKHRTYVSRRKECKNSISFVKLSGSQFLDFVDSLPKSQIYKIFSSKEMTIKEIQNTN